LLTLTDNFAHIGITLQVVHITSVIVAHILKVSIVDMGDYYVSVILGHSIISGHFNFVIYCYIL